MSDDDDWFERALRDEDDEEPEGSDDPPDDDPAATEEPAVGPENDANTDGIDEEPDTGDRDAPARRGADTETATAGDDEDAVGDDGGGDADGGSPFDQDFASALENAPDPDADSGEPQPGGGSGPFGGGSGGGDGGGGGSGGGGGGGSGGGDSPFGGQKGGGSPFGPGDGDDEFGFGDVGGEPESFEDAEFDSDLERLDVGIEGLDQMVLGGVPRRSLMVAIGSAGTGKTTFGLQFLHHGLERGEDAVYITLEESYDRIISTANEKGWGFGEYVDDDRLAVIDIDPIEMANSLDSIQNDLPNLIEEFGADRLVLDSVSLLEMMYESPPKRRSQVFGFARALKQAGITILLTSEADRDHAYASRFGIVEYLADAVFVLQYVRPSDFQETRLAIEIQKIRDANHSRETKPYDLTDEGISVYQQANIF